MSEENTIGLTDSAHERLQVLIAKESSDKKVRLRVVIDAGGCSGFQYSFKLDSETESDDMFFAHGDVEIVTDPASFELIKGSDVDFVENLMGAAFVISNPNAASSCGCGNSFSI